ncbi:MAG: hypothetical protein MAG715_00117 [Methanonatronarchaeales archaeon]|nr:hypothetical protein [Methanonatronarchaeales archaeon]
MKIEIVVDANVFISALIGGSTRDLLFDSRFGFMTTEFTVGEVEKYVPEIAEKAGVSEELVEEMFGLIPLDVVGRERYGDAMERASKMVADIDEKDVDILALALERDSYLWSDDRDFDDVEFDRILKTKDFF